MAALEGPGVGVGDGDGAGDGVGVGDGVVPGLGIGVGVGVGLEPELTEPHPVARVKVEANNKTLRQDSSLLCEFIQDLSFGEQACAWRDVQQQL
jgi:hypothetical protein